MNITNNLITAINNNIPISFNKYGDGEFACMTGSVGKNCDRDSYTNKLRLGLLNSFKYMIENIENTHIGLWHSNISQKQTLESFVNKPIKWADYHTIIMKNDDKKGEKINLYKTIKYSPIEKIIVCNNLLVKSKLLFNIDHMINIPFNNWFDTTFEEIINNIKKIITPAKQYIIITCGGMGSKVLICELSKLYPQNIYLDFGSAIDKICTKKTSRGWEPSYEELMEDLKELIPPNWNDTKYDNIYIKANTMLGVHL
jgi:hypothetical protein